MTHVFRHPKFYRIPRDKEEARAQLKVPSSNSDQAISLEAHDGERERAPDPGQSLKQQAPSSKLQAPSVKLSNQPEQASSDKRQAPSSKRQA
jgi:hypothetical protein